MTHRIMPYVLPLASILVISALFMFAKPAITGFLIVQQNPILNAEIKITADEVLPEDALISVYLLDKDNQTALELEKSSIKEFVNKYNVSLRYETGKNSQIGYEGKGYLGAAKINITKTDLKGIENGEYNIRIEISYKENIVSSSEQKVII